MAVYVFRPPAPRVFPGVLGVAGRPVGLLALAKPLFGGLSPLRLLLPRQADQIMTFRAQRVLDGVQDDEGQDLLGRILRVEIGAPCEQSEEVVVMPDEGEPILGAWYSAFPRQVGLIDLLAP